MLNLNEARNHQYFLHMVLNAHDLIKMQIVYNPLIFVIYPWINCDSFLL